MINSNQWEAGSKRLQGCVKLKCEVEIVGEGERTPCSILSQYLRIIKFSTNEKRFPISPFWRFLSDGILLLKLGYSKEIQSFHILLNLLIISMAIIQISTISQSTLLFLPRILPTSVKIYERVGSLSSLLL